MMSPVLFVVFLGCSVNAMLIPGKCLIQGNPWLQVGNMQRVARIVAMMGEQVGHNPFNVFPLMHKFGNCVKVYLSNVDNAINITIRCDGPSVMKDTKYQCPRYTPSVRWMLANLIYLKYDEHRFELSSCAEFNATHSYHGQMLLMDVDEPRSYTSPAEMLPRWRSKLAQVGMVPFSYSANCDSCLFHNEYVVHMSRKKPPTLEQLGPEPFCADGQPRGAGNETQVAAQEASSPALFVVLLCIVPVLIVGGLMYCKRAFTANSVAPNTAESTDKT